MLVLIHHHLMIHVQFKLIMEIKIGYGNTTDWQMRIAHSCLSMPSGLVHKAAIVEGITMEMTRMKN